MSDLISRQTAIDAVQGIGRLATLQDNDAVVRMSAVEYVLFNLPSAQPENIIQQFRDYQVEWLTSHCDLELEPTLEEWIVRFLNDTAECFELEGRING